MIILKNTHARRRAIQSIVPHHEVRLVEAYIRHWNGDGGFDTLSAEQFCREARIAAAAIDQGGLGKARKLADDILGKTLRDSLRG